MEIFSRFPALLGSRSQLALNAGVTSGLTPEQIGRISEFAATVYDVILSPWREYPDKHQPWPHGARPLSRCYLRSYLVKNTAGAHKEPNKKYKSNFRTLKSKSNSELNTSIA